jgi:magnesium chelatase family protein
MLVHAHSFAIHGGIAEHVHVELDTRGGLPAFSVIGLGGGAARDARERVQAAVLNSGFGFPRKRVTVNLAPAAARRSGAGFDLALACCVLASQDQLDADRLARVGLFAELGLGGDLRPCEAAGAAAEAAEQAGLAGLIVARSDLREARGASRLPVAGLGSLRDVARLLTAAAPRPPGRGGPRAADAEPARRWLAGRPLTSLPGPARAAATALGGRSPRRSPAALGTREERPP